MAGLRKGHDDHNEQGNDARSRNLPAMRACPDHHVASTFQFGAHLWRGLIPMFAIFSSALPMISANLAGPLDSTLIGRGNTVQIASTSMGAVFAGERSLSGGHLS